MHYRRLDGIDGDINIQDLRPRARVTRTREARHPLGTACTWHEACLAADDAIELLGGRTKDRGIWLWYCSHLGLERFLDLAYEVASCARQGELSDPVRAFQRRLMTALPKEVAE